MAVPLNWPLNVIQYESYFIVQKYIDSLVQGYIISIVDAVEITHSFKSSRPVTHFTNEANPSLSKPPLNYNSSLGKIGLIFLVK